MRIYDLLIIIISKLTDQIKVRVTGNSISTKASRSNRPN